MNVSPARWLARLIDLLVRYRFPILAVAVVASLLSVYPATQLKFNQSIESLYADDDVHLQDFLASKRLFGGDELVGVVYRDPDLFSKKGLARVRHLAETLSKVRGVKAESTQSLAGNLAAVDLPIFKTIFRKEIEAFRTRVIELVRGILVGDDNETTSVIVRLVSEQEAPVPRAQTIAAIRDIATRHQQETSFVTHVVVEPVQ